MRHWLLLGLLVSACGAAPGPSPSPAAPTPEAEPEADNAAALLNAASSSGSLPKEAILRGIRGAMATISGCYEAGLDRNPNLAGEVRTRIVIDTGGGVSVAADAGSTLPDAVALACMRKAYRQAVFEKPVGGSVTFVHPLTMGE